MNNIIKLDNNYYFELCDELNRKAINIQDLKEESKKTLSY